MNKYRVSSLPHFQSCFREDFRLVRTSASKWIGCGWNLDRSHLHLIQVAQKWTVGTCRSKVDWDTPGMVGGLRRINLDQDVTFQWVKLPSHDTRLNGYIFWNVEHSIARRSMWFLDKDVRTTRATTMTTCSAGFTVLKGCSLSCVYDVPCTWQERTQSVVRMRLTWINGILHIDLTPQSRCEINVDSI